MLITHPTSVMGPALLGSDRVHDSGISIELMKESEITSAGSETQGLSVNVSPLGNTPVTEYYDRDSTDIRLHARYAVGSS